MDHVLFIGSDDVVRASHNMQSAANDMRSAASNIESIFYSQQQFLTQWIERFEIAVEKLK